MSTAEAQLALIDALKLLQFDAGISPAAATGCPAIGQAEAVVPEPPEPLEMPSGTPRSRLPSLVPPSTTSLLTTCPSPAHGVRIV